MELTQEKRDRLIAIQKEINGWTSWLKKLKGKPLSQTSIQKSEAEKRIRNLKWEASEIIKSK